MAHSAGKQRLADITRQRAPAPSELRKDLTKWGANGKRLTLRRDLVQTVELPLHPFYEALCVGVTIL